MAHLTYEFAYLPASKAFQDDPSIARPAFDISKTKTPHPIWVGLQADAATFWNVTTWDSSATHKAYQASPEYPIFFSTISVVLEDISNPRATFLYVHFDRDPAPALDSPLTEIVLLSPRDGAKPDDVVRAASSLLALMVREKCVGVSGCAIGTVEDNPEEIVVVTGWEGVEFKDKLKQKIAGSNQPIFRLTQESTIVANWVLSNVEFYKH
ncbi:hypothetical protein K488DRAFT_88266 [Vararia minispora EC-137]|uniref:Uncharacterized protein n=1 Tax=Vararia minispora EC-137 TaxID=1314806 RepID=A0ACB8QE98_9AGAM|nr:hypothetical protein K488DRAFT_88266 [Vararia minispora EC-137]